MRAATLIALALALIVPAAGLSSPSSASTWRVVKSKSASGQFAKHPRGIAVRFVGNGVHGFAAWGCSRGLSVASWSRSYGRGLHTLGHVLGKDSCDVTASVSGQGRVTVQILKWQLAGRVPPRGRVRTSSFAAAGRREHDGRRRTPCRSRVSRSSA